MTNALQGFLSFLFRKAYLSELGEVFVTRLFELVGTVAEVPLNQVHLSKIWQDKL
jgi:hypothetical protein